MLIAGYDMELLGGRTPYDLAEALGHIAKSWVDACVSIVTPEYYEGYLKDLTPIQTALTRKLEGLTEVFVFVFRDENAYLSWEKDGLTDTNYDDLISISLRQDGVFFVVGDKDSTSKEIVDGAIRAIEHYRSTHSIHSTSFIPPQTPPYLEIQGSDFAEAAKREAEMVAHEATLGPGVRVEVTRGCLMGQTGTIIGDGPGRSRNVRVRHEVWEGIGVMSLRVVP
mgnify:CR=1 FL=1